ncbi:endophilin-B1-like [Solea senegalensis]|uniref:Endophilin-B1-like n=2 Tax=Solea senegalensis TaxID=28829 RepID=A0AAV6RXT1_SOLSE|nr:endophilin-B1-like isoform X2 [Solea senegalensis]KAG7510172.1 endophilin-B1-like [Solea senegalensis]
MDLTRLAVDAGQFINRAIQFTGESLGQAGRTELDPGLEELLTRAEATKTCTDKIISQTEVLLLPNPGARLEDRLYEHLEWSVPPRPRANELLGNEMTQAGLEIGSTTPYGAALLRCGEVQKQLSDEERKFVQSTNIHFLSPLRSYTEGEYKAIQDERRMLLNRRLDLDIAKSRLRKAHEAEREDRSLNANPLDEDHRSHVSFMFSFLRVKWLKIWAQQISQAEMELSICQSLFDRQSEMTRRALEGISNTHTNHLRSLTDFVEAQACYFDQCNQHAQELQKQLASIPAVLCSNNWLSEVSHQPPTSNHVVKERSGSNQVTSLPLVVHHLPDFNQDSWTVNPPSVNGKTSTDSSVHTQLLDTTNNNYNNNNNNEGHSSEKNRYFSAATQAVYVSTSNSDNHTTDQLSAAEAAASGHTVKNSSAAAISNDAGHEMTTPSPRPSQPSATLTESQMENAVSSETMATSAVADELQTSIETANEQLVVDEDDVQESQSDRDVAE